MPDERPRLSIPTRIFLGFALLLVAFGGVAVTSVVQHERTAHTLRLLHEGYLPLALTVGEAKATQAVFGTLLDRVMSERDPTATRNWLNAARQVRPATLRRALYGVSRARELAADPRDQALLADVEHTLGEVGAAYRASDVQYDQLFEALVSGDDAGAERVLSELRQNERGIQDLLRDARSALQERIATLSADAEENERRASVLLGALAMLGLVLGLVVIFAAHRMLSPLPRIMERVAAISRGDLSSRLEPRKNDELGRLAAELERMVDALSARDQRLREAAEAEIRLKRMQEQIVTALRAAVVVIDGEDRIRTVNPAAERVLGVAPTDVEKTSEESGLLTRLPPLAGAIEDVRAGAERAVLVAVPVVLHDDELALNALVTPFVAADADRGSVLVVAEDVTEELRTKARLIDTERLAAIGRMAAHVTHEVRNPLSSIGLNVEMLEEELAGAGPESKALMRAIQREIDRLTGITEEYLRLARLPDPRLEPEDVGALVRSIASFVTREMEGSGVTIALDVEENLPQVALDEQQIRQALLNLLRNAREAMPEGGHIHLDARRRADGVEVRVRDEGPGIPDAERERIFDLFYTTKERGTGLGLPLTQQIVVAHGGHIRCEGGPGRGTTFELWLPIADEPSDAPRPSQARAIDAGPTEH